MRYIDADEIDYTVTMVGRDEYAGVRAVAFESDIDAMPTADVAPRSEFEELVCKLERLLCHATGGKLSKHTYELWVMETAVTDHINEAYSDGLEDGYKECAKEIFDKIYRKLGFFIKHRDVNDTIANMLYFIEQVEKEYTEGNQ